MKNKLHWVKNVDGRTKAYKVAANKSSTEYFYAVFAKSMVNDDFKFDFTVDRGQTKKHRIFHSYLKEVDLSYGTFNINLYNKFGNNNQQIFFLPPISASLHPR